MFIQNAHVLREEEENDEDEAVRTILLSLIKR